MDTTENYYQTLLRLKSHIEMQLVTINAGIAEIEKQRLPPEPKKRRNLKDERVAELRQNRLKGKVLKPSWLKTPKRSNK